MADLSGRCMELFYA